MHGRSSVSGPASSVRWLAVLAVGAVLAPLAQPAPAVCPGTRACQLHLGCGPTAIVVGPGASIQGAINAAPSGATICVLPGTYSGKIDFKGKNITLISSGGPVQTILQGSGSPSGPVVTFQTFEGADSVLEGFGIRNGSAPFGGGIFVSNASPTIRNCILTGNTATGDQYSRGGGAWVAGAAARPTFICDAFVSNHADYSGGGLTSAASADPYLRSCSFQGNQAAFGGGISAYGSGRLDVGGTELVGNAAQVDGGGIHAGTTYGNVLIRDSWLHGNTAVSKGGGLFVPAGLAQVVNCTFNDNKAKSGAGAAAASGSMLDVASTIFVHNATSGGGSSTLAAVAPAGAGTSVVNHYNDFFANTGGNYLNTFDNVGLSLLDPQLSVCCPAVGSPVLNAGIPDAHFNDPNGTRNDMGACGGPPI